MSNHTSTYRDKMIAGFGNQKPNLVYQGRSETDHPSKRFSVRETGPISRPYTATSKSHVRSVLASLALGDAPSAPPAEKLEEEANTVSTVPAKDYVDARISEVIALQRAEFAQVDTKIDRLLNKVDQLPSFRAMLLTAVTVAFAALGIIYAGLQYGAATYSVGLTAAPVVNEAITRQAEEFGKLLSSQGERDASQDAKLVEIDEKLDILINAISLTTKGEVSPQ